MYLRMWLCVALAVMASCAFGQPAANTIGVYMPAAIQACNARGWGWYPPDPPVCCPSVGCVHEAGQFQASVIVANTSLACTGAEFGYHIEIPAGFEDRIFILSAELPAGAINIGGPPGALTGDFVIGLQAPIPPSTSITLVTWTFLVTDPLFTMQFYLGDTATPSLAGGLPVLHGEGGALAHMNVESGFIDAPVAVVNLPGSPIPEFCLCNQGVPVDNETFGAVKALYR